MDNAQPLLDQELSEANAYLAQFDKVYETCALFIGGSIVATLALPLMILVHWLIGSGHLVRGVIAGVIVLFLVFSIGLWWLSKWYRLFREIKSRCLKLQRAGYVVYKRPMFLHNVLSATSDVLQKEVQVLDFERLTPWELHDLMI